MSKAELVEILSRELGISVRKSTRLIRNYINANGISNRAIVEVHFKTDEENNIIMSARMKYGGTRHMNIGNI